MFSGDIPKGMLYKPLASINNRSYAATNFDGSAKTSQYNLPKEIVEQWWEVVYEDEFKVGDIVVVTEQYHNNSAHVNQIVRLTRMDLDSSIKYECEDYFNLYNWGIKRTWCLNVRLATPEEIKSIQTKTIAVGENKKIMVTIHKGKIVTESQTLNIELFTDLLDVMDGDNCLVIADWDVTFPTVKIGCTTLPKSDIELIINTYNSLNE